MPGIRPGWHKNESREAGKEPDVRGSLEGAAIIRRRSGTDNYSTPIYTAQALFEKEHFRGTLWEPAVGEGNIIAAHHRMYGDHPHGIRWLSSDIRIGTLKRGLLALPQEYLLHQDKVDFIIEESPWPGKIDHVITNPPFRFAQQFAEKALEIVKPQMGAVALLLRIQFLESEKRRAFLESSPLRRVWVFAKRVSMYPEGVEPEKRATGTQCFAWFVWDWRFGTKCFPMIGWV
jgi:hypothetical protein